MSDYVLDTVALHAMAFGHPRGVEILLEGLAVDRLRFPAEVYNFDENALPPGANDESLSELARGIRYARGQLAAAPGPLADRCRVWLNNATQLGPLLSAKRLVVDSLEVDELLRREELQTRFHIGRGEAACITLAERLDGEAVFLSSDAAACKAASSLEIRFCTILDVLEMYIDRMSPTRDAIAALLAGLQNAKFALKADDKDRLLAKGR
jgi:predicted nucleic acid-binding protein